MLVKIFLFIFLNIIILFQSITFAKVLLDEQFNEIILKNIWHIPTWASPTDGTFVGRTQFRCSQNSPLPIIVDGKAIILMDTYNPTALPELPSFY